GGMARTNWMTGSKAALSRLENPIRVPISMPKNDAIRNPARNFPRLGSAWSKNPSPSQSCAKVQRISCNDGAYKLVEPYDRNHHTTSMVIGKISRRKPSLIMLRISSPLSAVKHARTIVVLIAMQRLHLLLAQEVQLR